jgi:pilus assembly protein CpaF
MNHAPADRALECLLAPLGAWLSTPGVTEIMINGPEAAWIEQGGVLQQIPESLPPASVVASARLVATLSANDTLDAEAVLEGTWRGWRMTFVLPPVSADHACLSMRRHRAAPVRLETWSVRPGTVAPAPLAAAGLRSEPALQALRAGLARHDNILIAGSTGAGKTTLLASLLAELDGIERLVCLEDSPELPRIGPHQVRLQTRQGHTMRSLLRLALRLRPDRLVVGEVRGPEAFDLLQAMATGHRGCLGTIHAPDPLGALARLEQLILTAGLNWPLEAIRSQIAEWIHLVVQVVRTPAGRAITVVHRVRPELPGSTVPRCAETVHNAGSEVPRS